MSESLNDRKTVANILRSVLMKRCSVRQAMLAYPKDTQDESLIAAYHALVHYEADEDIRYQRVAPIKDTFDDLRSMLKEGWD